MSLVRAFEKGAGQVVIIDDLYLPPNPDSVGGDELSALLRALRTSPADCAALAALVEKPGITDASALVDLIIEDLDKAYKGYISGLHPYLEVLFSGIDEIKNSELGRLRMLEAAVTAFFNVKPQTFGGLEEARQQLATCAVVFADFFLDGVTNHEEARRHHAAVKDELGTKFIVDDEHYPKLVVIMSTALPDARELATFRQDTGVRAAFFHALDKNLFTPESLKTSISGFAESYGPAEKLNKYLETMEREVKEAAESLARELRSGLDVHDLTILKTLRLDGESDTPQAYLTLLLSEALAARVRMAAPLQAEVLPKTQTYGDSPFDGKLLPSSVLFQLFADIAVAPTPTSGEVKVSFGDVMQSLAGDDKDSLYLAISPACDLQRCELHYEVLCVRGQVEDCNTSLSALFEKKYSFGKGNVVLKTKSEAGDPIYSRINFDSTSIRTIKASEFKNGEKYKRLARLTEVFAQEIKTLALNNVARVGVPIDPSFSIGLKAKVRFNLRGDQKGESDIQAEMEVDDTSFIPAVLAMGREIGDERLQPTVMFSLQFKNQIQAFIASELKKVADSGKKSNKLDAIRQHFTEPESFKIAINSRNLSKSIGQHIRITYVPRLGKLPEVKNFEILLYSELEEDPPGPEQAAAPTAE